MELRKGERLYSVGELAAELVGMTVSQPTVWRWVNEGVCGGAVKLECMRLGAKWLTTRTAFLRFMERQTEHTLGVEHQEEPADVERRGKEAGAALAALGC